MTGEAAARALELVPQDGVVGLGTGRAAARFVTLLGSQVKAGLRVRAVPTSLTTATLARRLRIPVVDLAAVGEIDVTVDGADEVDPHLDLIKGYGGALVREKIVAAASRRLVIVVGEEKLVPVLGARGRLPVEIVPFGASLCMRRLAGLGCQAVARKQGGRLFVSDNGNHVLDCRVSPIRDSASLERKISSIPGVVGSGLFLDMADVVLVQRGGGAVEVRHRKRRRQ